MISETKKWGQPLSREAVRKADELIEELSNCILNVGDETVFLLLKEAKKAFDETFNRPNAGQEIIHFTYNKMVENLVAALRHYDYISLTARNYVSKRLSTTALINRYNDLVRLYKGNVSAQAVVTRTSKTYDTVIYKLSNGLEPTDAELILFEEQISQCEQVVIAG